MIMIIGKRNHLQHAIVVNVYHQYAQFPRNVRLSHLSGHRQEKQPLVYSLGLWTKDVASHSRSFKVIEIGADRQIAYNLLFVCHTIVYIALSCTIVDLVDVE